MLDYSANNLNSARMPLAWPWSSNLAEEAAAKEAPEMIRNNRPFSLCCLVTILRENIPRDRYKAFLGQ